MKKETLKQIINSFHTASTDETRYHLSCVLLEVKDKKVTIVSTDGHALTKVMMDDSLLAEHIGDRRYLVTNEQLPILKLMLKEMKYLPESQNMILNEDKSIQLKSLEYETTLLTEAQLNSKYPNYESIIPAKSAVKPIDKISFNPILLLNITKALGVDKSHGLILQFTGPENPLLITTGNSEKEDLGVLMPMRM